MARRFVTLTDAEIVKIIEQLDDYNCAPERKVMLRGLYVLMSNLGLRVSEALALRWKDFDYARKEVTVETLKSQGRRAARAKREKDTIPVDAETLAAVRACQNGGRPSDRIFPIGRGVAYNIWQRLMALAQVRPKKLHCLRHSAVTRWLKTTQDLAFAQHLARHSSPVTTGQYVHCDNLAQQFQRVPKLSVKFEAQPSPRPSVQPAPAPSQSLSHPPPVLEPKNGSAPDEMLARMARMEEGFLTMARALEQFVQAKTAPPPVVEPQRALPPGPGVLRNKLAGYGLDSPAELARAARTTRQHAWRLLAGERYGVTIAKRIAAAVRVPWAEVLEWQDGPSAEQAEAAARPARV